MPASNWLILVTTVIYACVSIAAIFEGNKGKAILFAGYALANTGIIFYD